MSASGELYMAEVERICDAYQAIALKGNEDRRLDARDQAIAELRGKGFTHAEAAGMLDAGEQ